MHKSALYASGHAHYLAARANFMLGDDEAALKHVDDLCRLECREAPFTKRELAEALKARILIERGLFEKGINQLYALDKQVTKKHWPYQMCIIKLHLAEVLIGRGMLEPAEKLAKNSLRLARGMQVHASYQSEPSCSGHDLFKRPYDRQLEATAGESRGGIAVGMPDH